MVENLGNYILFIIHMKMLDHSTSYIYPPGVEEPAYTVECLQHMVATNQ